MAGAEAIFYPTAIGWLDGEESLHRARYESWDTMLRSHAIANGVFVVAVNRTGREGHCGSGGRAWSTRRAVKRS